MHLPDHLTLQAGDSGEFVTELQRRLKQRDLLFDGNISGLYDGLTAIAVRSFQEMSGLKADGIAGPNTIRKLTPLSDAEIAEEDTNESSGETEEEKDDVEELGEALDDFNISLKAQDDFHKNTNEAIRETTEKEDTTIDELRAVNEEEHGLGREEEALWQQEEKLQVQETLEKRADQRQEIVNTQHDIENAKQLAAANQLEASQNGVEAKTPTGDIAQQPQRIQLQEQIHDHAASGGDQQLEALPYFQAEQETGMNMQSPQTVSVPEPVTPQRSPELMRTEAQLSPDSQIQSISEGQMLYAGGIRDNGTISQSELGQLVPSQTPAIGPQQQVGIGA